MLMNNSIVSRVLIIFVILGVSLGVYISFNLSRGDDYKIDVECVQADYEYSLHLFERYDAVIARYQRLLDPSLPSVTSPEAKEPPSCSTGIYN